MFSNRCRHQNGAFSWSELAQGLFSVSLRAVAVDTGAGVALAVQEVLQGVCTFLGLHKHQSQRVLALKTEREDGWCQPVDRWTFNGAAADAQAEVFSAGSRSSFVAEPTSFDSCNFTA